MTPRLVVLDDDPDQLPVHVVETPDLRLALLPTVGGRLISARCGGVELLWRNPDYLDAELRTVRRRADWAPLDGGMGSWANLGGSKTWPAPQGWSGPDEWPGPPDAVLDAGEWELTSAPSPDGGLVVTMTSPDDARTGLRVVRELEVPATGTSFRQRATFTNVSDRRVRWSVWEVCQVDTSSFATARRGADDPSRRGVGAGGAGLWVDVSGDAAPVHLVDAFGELSVGPAAAGSREVLVRDVVGKVGFTDATGRIVLRRPDGAGIEWRFDVPPGAYPDGGCAAEIWMQYPTPGPVDGPGSLHPTAHLVELEALSPLTDLAPGESTGLSISWTLTPPVA